jgi:hypothetical protein
MEQKNTKKDANNNKKPKVGLFLFVIPILLLILLVGGIHIGIYLVEQSDSDVISQVLGLSMLLLFIMVILVFMFVMFHYLEIRYLYIPVWRWIASGFKGEPKLPFPRLAWAKKSVRVEARSKMNKKQRACIWLGNICSFVGTILMLYCVVWHLILTIKGDRTVGHVSFILFLIGTFIFFTGVCVSGLVYQRILKTRSFLEIDNEG